MFIIRKKLFLGYGHFTNVYYDIHCGTKKEVAFKTPRISERINFFKDEAFILKILEAPNFYHKLYVYDEIFFNDYLLISLMGPSLMDFRDFYGQPFDKKTIINNGDDLFSQIEYLYNKNVLHRDITADNISFGFIKESTFESKRLYLIDYGLSIYMDKNSEIKKYFFKLEKWNNKIYVY